MNYRRASEMEGQSFPMLTDIVDGALYYEGIVRRANIDRVERGSAIIRMRRKGVVRVSIPVARRLLELRDRFFGCLFQVDHEPFLARVIAVALDDEEEPSEAGVVVQYDYSRNRDVWFLDK